MIRALAGSSIGWLGCFSLQHHWYAVWQYLMTND
jgi:hypothetical protein